MHKVKFLPLSTCFLILIFFFPIGPVFSQQLPPGEDIGAQSERLREEMQQKQLESLEKKIKPWLESQEEKKKALTKDISFVLKRVQVTGSTIFAPEFFRPIYEPYLDKKVNFKDLETIIEKIKFEYKKKGYLAASAYLPNQDVSLGNVEIKVIEGRMGKLKIEGNKWFSDPLIRKYFHTQEGDLLDFNRLQRDILRLNLNPDAQINALISPGEKPQSADVTLKVKDYVKHHLGAGIDNQGTRAIGRTRYSQFYRNSNLSGNLDNLFISSVFSERSLGEGLSYSVPIGTRGTRLGIDYYYFQMELGKEFRSFEIKGKSQDFDAYMDWELALREDFRANMQTGLSAKSFRKRQRGQIITKEELRIPYLGFDFYWAEPNGNVQLNPRFSFGVPDFLGSSEKGNDFASRGGSDKFFFKFENSLSRLQKMPFSSHVVSRLRVQATSNTLPSSEQMQLGGISSIRGYPEGDYLADNAAILNVDWFFPLYFVPVGFKLPLASVDLRQQLNPEIFADVGWGMLEKTNLGEKSSKFLASLGIGFRVRLHDKVNVFLQWAQDIGDEPRPGAGQSEFNFIVQVQL